MKQWLIPKSIRWRLQLWIAFLLVGVLLGFGVTAYQLHRTNRFGQIDDELEQRVATLGAAVRTPPFPGRRGGPQRFFGDGPGGRRPQPPPDGPLPDGRPPEMRFSPREVVLPASTLRLFEEPGEAQFYYAIWARDGATLRMSTNAPAGLERPERAVGDTATRIRMRGGLREAFHFTEMGDCVLAGRSIESDLGALNRFAGWLLLAGCAVLGLGLGGGWWLTSRAIRPVKQISATAGRISAGNLSERISLDETDSELGQLAGVLNSTFARMEAAFKEQEQFTADASHELRTPLTILISEAQATLARDRKADEYRETVETCLDTAQQMRRLTESLLQLARFDAGQETLERQPFDLAVVVNDCVERMQSIAAERGVRIRSELVPALAVGDPERFSQVILNLLANAIHYNRPNGEVIVRTSTLAGSAVLSISDNGVGISPADLPHIFERFYRADKSRSSASGRSGLGLSICKAVVDALGGRIEVASKPGEGSVFTVRLPEADSLPLKTA